MFKNIFIVVLALVFVCILQVPSYSQGGMGCTRITGCDAATDYGSNPLAQTGNYDPCDNYLCWTFIFSRTDEDEGHGVIEYRIEGETTSDIIFFQDVHSWLYDPNVTDTLSGTKFVGTSNQHNLKIYRMSQDAGYFYDIDAEAEYKAGTPN